MFVLSRQFHYLPRRQTIAFIRTPQPAGGLEVWWEARRPSSPSDLQARRDPRASVWRLTPARCPQGSASSSRVFKNYIDRCVEPYLMTELMLHLPYLQR